GGAAFPTLALSDGGGLIALPYLDKTVRVKDTRQGTEFGKVTHQQLAHSVAMTKDGKYAASGSDDGTARVIETGTGYPIAVVPMGAPVESVAFTKENNLEVVSGKTVRTVNVFDRPAFQSLPGTVGISPGGKYRSAF